MLNIARYINKLWHIQGNSKEQWHRVNVLRRKSTAQTKEALSKDGLKWEYKFFSQNPCDIKYGWLGFPGKGKIGINYLKDDF